MRARTPYSGPACGAASSRLWNSHSAPSSATPSLPVSGYSATSGRVFDDTIRTRHRAREPQATSRTTLAVAAAALPSGCRRGRRKKTNKPQGKPWTSLTSTPWAASAARAARMSETTICIPSTSRLVHPSHPSRSRSNTPIRAVSLDEAHAVTDLDVHIGDKPGLVDIEVLRAVDVRDGDGDDSSFQSMRGLLSGGFRAARGFWRVRGQRRTHPAARGLPVRAP